MQLHPARDHQAADISVAGLALLDKFNMATSCLAPSTETPRAADGRQIPTFGQLPVKLKYGKVTKSDNIHILRGVEGLLLSWKTARDLHLLPRDYPAQISQVTSSGIASHEDGSAASPSTLGGVHDEGAAVPPATDDAVPRAGQAQERACHTLSVRHQAASAAPSAADSAPGPPATDDAVPRAGQAQERACHTLSVRHQAAPAAPSAADSAPGPAAPSAAAAAARPTASSAAGPHTDSDIRNEFPDVFDGVIRAMPGEQYKIVLRTDAVPHAVRAPRRVPFALREPLRLELETLQRDGIITPVTEPTDWCAPIVVAQKKSGGVRLCVDLSKLNSSVRRELYQTNTPAECVASIIASEARWFAVFDAQKGYHQCPLDVASQPLTTFITPFGRYMYLRAPYGVCSISEHYNRRMDECFEGIPGIERLVDDVIVYGRTQEELIQRTRQLLQRCREKGVSLNRQKIQFMKQEAKFAGFIVSKDGYRLDPALTEAIASFPTPTDITDLRSFFGLANQLAPFSDTVAKHLLPLRELLSTKREFYWDESHQSAFIDARAALSSPPTLAFYDPRLVTRLSTDASKLHGMGFVLQQQQRDETWSVVQAGSRFITDTETRYAAIELEMAAVVWAFKKCRLFLSGLPHIDVFVDHRPLVPIMNAKTLDQIENPRLQRLKMQLGEFGPFTAHWTRGAEHLAADALSRSPITAGGEEEEEVDPNPDAPGACYLFAITSEDNMKLDEVRSAVAGDETAQLLRETVLAGFPNQKKALPAALRPYWQVHEHLSVDDGLVVYGRRIVVPAALRRLMLQRLHASHLGLEKTKQRARQLLYWPGMGNEIDNLVRYCTACQRELPSQPRETLIHRPAPSRPFTEVSMDFGDYAGHKFLVTVDHTSGWQFVTDLGIRAVASQLISASRDVFCMVGVPNTIWSDGGPQFCAKSYQDFLRRWGVAHRVSSPAYPQSNGRAEAAVKTTKKLIRRCWDARTGRLDPELWAAGILQHRNTPGPDGRSPAEILFGRPMQDLLPAHRRNFRPEWQKSAEEAESAAAQRQEQVELQYNVRATDLPALKVGNQVAVQDQATKRWDRYGEVVEVCDHRRYLVKLASGRVLSRNRRHLRRRYGHAAPEPVRNPADGNVSSPGPRRTAPAGLGSRPAADAIAPAAVPRAPPAAPAVEPLCGPGRHRSDPDAPPAPRRSTRRRRRPERLIEVMT